MQCVESDIGRGCVRWSQWCRLRACRLKGDAGLVEVAGDVRRVDPATAGLIGLHMYGDVCTRGKVWTEYRGKVCVYAPRNTVFIDITHLTDTW